MTMDPKEYIHFSHQILNSKDMQHEAGYRSVTSRVYYSAFIICRDIILKQGIPFQGTASDHNRVQMVLNNSGSDALSKISSDLNNLMKSRKSADYDYGNQRFNTPKTSIFDLKIAEHIVSVVKTELSGPNKDEITGGMLSYAKTAKII